MYSRRLIVFGAIIFLFGLILVSPIAEFLLKVLGLLIMLLGLIIIVRGILISLHLRRL